MREHNKAFCRIAVETFECPAPVYEFGSYQVDGQEGFADLRSLFPGKAYVGCDMRPGPGVDRVENVSSIHLPDASAGTILCIETFEHVFDIFSAFREVHRVLKPGGVFLITSPFNFRIHGYPDDYWRMTPQCLRGMLGDYAARLTGFQGHDKFPHTVMGLAIKAPAPADFSARARGFMTSYQAAMRALEARRPWSVKAKERITKYLRSRAERHMIDEYHRAEFALDLAPALAAVG